MNTVDVILATHERPHTMAYAIDSVLRPRSAYATLSGAIDHAAEGAGTYVPTSSFKPTGAAGSMRWAPRRDPRAGPREAWRSSEQKL